jgi:hypothetical protein
MRDWLLLLTPIGLITYFLIYPDRFTAFIRWAQHIWLIGWA